MLIGFSAFKNRNWPQTDTDYMLDILKRAGLKCIEIVFAWKKEVFKGVSTKNKEWLKKIKYLSIHAPYRENIDAKTINELKRLGKELDAKRFVFHPGFDFSKLKDFPFCYSIENVRKIRGYDINYIKKELNNNKQLGLCLDTSHTFSFSKKKLLEYIGLFNNRISHVHLSGYHKGKEHVPLSKCSKNFLESLKPVKELKVPMMLELDWESQNPRDIKKEIAFAENFLKN